MRVERVDFHPGASRFQLAAGPCRNGDGRLMRRADMLDLRRGGARHRRQVRAVHRQELEAAAIVRASLAGGAPHPDRLALARDLVEPLAHFREVRGGRLERSAGGLRGAFRLNQRRGEVFEIVHACVSGVADEGVGADHAMTISAGMAWRSGLGVQR